MEAQTNWKRKNEVWLDPKELIYESILINKEGENIIMKRVTKFFACLLMCCMIVMPSAVSTTHASGNPPVCDHTNNMYLAYSTGEYVHGQQYVRIGGLLYIQYDMWENYVYRCPICGYERVYRYHIRYDYELVE